MRWCSCSGTIAERVATASRLQEATFQQLDKGVVVLSKPAALNPRKLLHSKWTAANPQHKEKHFLVTGIVDPDPPGSPVVSVELEAVHSKRVRVMPWRELMDATQWKRGWG